MKTIYNPLISIITINYNSVEVTIDFLRSLKLYCLYPKIEVIVVDNNSIVDPTNLLLNEYPGVKIIRNKENVGFSAGNNVGIKAAQGEYFFIVNNDTEFTPDLLENLLSIFNDYPDAGIVCPKFRSFYHKDIIEYAGYNKVNNFTGRISMIGTNEKDNGQYDNISITNYAHGGAMLVSREVVDNVGIMPEEFFLYYEELDWSEQIKQKGYKIYYQPKALIYHKESLTTGKNSPLKTFYLTRNRILFMKRRLAFLNYVIFLIYFIFFTIPKNTFVFLLNRQWKHLKSFWSGICWHFKLNTSKI